MEIARLFVILDEDRDNFLDEMEIIQWAADVGLSWSSAEVKLKEQHTSSYKTLLRRGKSSKQQISTQITSLIHMVGYNEKKNLKIIP